MANLTTQASDSPSSVVLTDDTGTLNLTDGFLLQPTVTVVSSANPSSVGVPVTFSVAVSGSGGTPTGSVYISVDGIILASGTLVSGAFSSTTSSLLPGTRSIGAFYSGDSGVTYDSAFAGVFNQAIGPAAGKLPWPLLLRLRLHGVWLLGLIGETWHAFSQW